ncbi:hypothetical protein BH11PAT2_BH11PAT2_03640 [soil metagenome]
MNPDDVKPKTDSPYTPPSDPSAYIRTYAKDVAMLTNSPVPAPVAVAAKPQTTTEDGVTLSDYDASPVNHSDNPSSPKEFKSEVVALSQDDSKDIFTTQGSSPASSAPTPTPVSMMPQASIGVTSNVVSDDTAPEREAILARLRAKLASHSPTAGAIPEPILQTAAQTPTPTPEPLNVLQEQASLVSEPAPVIAPQFETPPEEPVVPLPIREPIPPTPAVPQFPPMPEVRQSAPPAQVAQPMRATQPPNAGASPLHTFSSDFSDRIDSQRASTFSVLASQSDAGPAAIVATKKRSRLVPILAGVVLLLCGIGAVAGALLYSNKTNTVPMVAGVPSLLTFDESVEVKGTGANLMQAVADVAGQASVSGNVIVTYVTAPGTTGGNIPQQGGALIKLLPLNAPDILMRNIDDASTVGTVAAGTESRPFLVLRVNSYERTFAGMLAWEPTLAASLSTFFPAYTDVSTAVVASTTSTTSPAVSAPIAIASPFFSDAVVANHDVRVLRDSKGRSLILYGYADKDTLVLARDEAAFTALISRITATKSQ